MDEIKAVYSNDIYYPFVEYCESQGYRVMTDLARCPFHKLASESDITPSLVSRVKTIFLMYCKKHPEALRAAAKPAASAPAKKKTASAAAPAGDILGELEPIFQKNCDKLIHIAEISKAIGKKYKRADILSALQKADWCKIVDDTTFFYSAAQSHS